MEIVLTQHQSDILKQSLEILDKEDFLVITGKAGTGKTTLVKFLIQELKKQAKHIRKVAVCSAPTNKAVKVLREKIEDGTHFGKDFRTVHSALRLKRSIHPKTGEISFQPDKTSSKDPLDNCSILIVDEASMINSFILDYIIQELSYRGIKVIFIGDDGQLPPVGEKYSKVFKSGFPILELTEIIRQGEGNPIIDLSRNFGLLRTRRDDRREIGGYIFSNNRQQVIETLAAINGTDDLKYLSWTNQDVDAINKAVRERIYTNPAKIEVGESLVFDSPYGDYFTNDEITVNSLKVEERPFTAYSISNPNYNMDALDEPEFLTLEKKLKFYVINDNVKVIHEDSEEVFKEMIKSFKSLCIKQIAKWKDFYLFAEIFAQVKYNHALTIHKSQGSTYKQVIINIRNCMYNKDMQERDKLLYTAITRASELVVLYNV